MKIFAISDLHIDYEANAAWLDTLPEREYRNDILILAGDVSDSLTQIEIGLSALASRFHRVFYVPGNHELWVMRDIRPGTSFEKFHEVCALAENCGVSVKPFGSPAFSIIPLFSWYDYSFGAPCNDLSDVWMDFRACKWPPHTTAKDVASFFARLNEPLPIFETKVVITFSHFLPRLDLMPASVPAHHRFLYPVLGTNILERQIRQTAAKLHVYGHSHVNRRVALDGITYINNAFGYPTEGRIAAKRLLCIYDDERSIGGLVL